MIVICDKAQDVIIPAGLGDNPGVVYEKSGVESLNGQQGDLTLKTVNGNELLGEGNVAIDTGVESLNGQKGALTLKTVNGNELTGEGNIEIQAGVESVNGETGAVKIKTIDNKDVLGEGNMDILSDYKICMFMAFNLTLSEADKGIIVYNYGIGDDGSNFEFYFSGWKTIQFLYFTIKDGASYKVPLTIFWGGDGDGNGNRQFRFVCEGYEYTYTSTGGNGFDFTSKVKIGGESGLKYFELTADKAKEAYDEVVNHWDSLSGYTGDYVFTYNNRKGNIANYYFVKITHIDDATGNYVLFSCVDTDAAFNYNDSKIKIFSVIVYNNNNGANYNLRTYYNTFTIPTKTSQLTNDSGFLNELGVAETFSKFELYTKTYYFFNDPTRDPNAPNAHNVEVFRAFDKAVQEGGAFNNFYIVNGNETSGQTPLSPILQVTKMEAVDNGVWGGNKGYYVFAGQKSNVETEKLQVHKYCLTDIGGVIDFMVNAVDGGTWTSGVHSKIDDVLTAGQDIPFVFEYLEGCDETYFWADNMGGKQGLYNITFNGGYDGYKGNVVADVYGNNTGVYMAFTVNNVRYTYKKNDTNSKWELAKSVQIGGVQSAEVSNIKVLTQSEYDALEPKDPNTMYCIKGQ